MGFSFPFAEEIWIIFVSCTFSSLYQIRVKVSDSFKIPVLLKTIINILATIAHKNLQLRNYILQTTKANKLQVTNNNGKLQICCTKILQNTSNYKFQITN